VQLFVLLTAVLACPLRVPNCMHRTKLASLLIFLKQYYTAAKWTAISHLTLLGYKQSFNF